MSRSFVSAPSRGLCVVSITVLFAAMVADAAHPAASYSVIDRDSAAPQDGHDRALRATGHGAMPTANEEPNRAKAYLMAKAYAKMDAVANLLQAVGGTAMKYRATGSDFKSEQHFSQAVDGEIEGVKIVSERKIQEGKDTIVEITVEAPDALVEIAPPAAEAFDTSIPAPVQVASAAPNLAWTAPVPRWSPPAATIGPTTIRPAKESPYTSVVIDATGLKVARSMSPKILRPDGSEVWGTVKIDPDFVQDHGIVAYARSLADAYANPRAGDNPLVLRAIARGSSSYHADAVISGDDAEYLLSQNAPRDFLSKYQVIFVIDPSRF